MMIALLAAVCSWFFLLVLIPQLRMQLLDQPNSRSSHSQPTPRGGGVAFAVLGVASSVIAMICGHDSAVAVLPSLAAPLAVVGLLDDRQNLPASCRYVVQLFTAVLILGFSPLVQGIGLAVASGSLLLLPVLAFLAIAVTAVINFTNFMDGLDGLVAGCMAINIAALAYSLIPVGRCGSWWALCSAFCSGTGAPPRCSWAMWEAPFLEQSSLVCYSNPSVGRRPLATCWWRLLCWVMPVYVSPAVCLLASACSRPTVSICFSVCTRLAGLIPAFLSHTLRLRPCLLLFCLHEPGLGYSAWLLLSFCLVCGWISVSRCPFLWRPRANGFLLFDQRIGDFAACI